MSIPLLLIGGGGHCAACIDVVESSGLFTIAGIVDTIDKIGFSVCGYSVFATDADLAELRVSYSNVLITIGQIKSAIIRIKLYDQLKQLGFVLPVITAKSAVVSRSSSLSDGIIIMHCAVVNSNASLGENCIINTRAIIEHDVCIGAHTHVSTGAIVNGGCRIGNACLVGSGAVLKQGITLADEVIIGAGSVVIKDVTEPGVYAGNPARKICG